MQLHNLNCMFFRLVIQIVHPGIEFQILVKGHSTSEWQTETRQLLLCVVMSNRLSHVR